MIIVSGWLKTAAVTCDLARTELMRAVRRAVPDRVLQAREVLDAVTLVQVTPAVFEDAGRLDPTGLRSHDAIHLAAALDLGDDLDGLMTYHDRLADAAVSNGVAVTASGPWSGLMRLRRAESS